MFIHEIKTSDRTWRFESGCEVEAEKECATIRKMFPQNVIIHSRLSRFLTAAHGLVEVKAWDEHFPPLGM